MKSRKPELKFYCYEDVSYNLFSAEIASEIASLTLRANITGRIDVEDWKNLLRERINYGRKVLNCEVNSIHQRATYECTCISGLHGKSLEQDLTRKGHEVNLINIEEFYHPTPLEILEERLGEGDVSNEEAEKLVKDHLEYVKNYILISENRDQAYYQWIYDKFPSLREKIDPKEIKYSEVSHPNNI